MWGTKLCRMVNGNWDHVGTLRSSLPAGYTYPAGTHLAYQVTGTYNDNEDVGVLASGYAVGFTTQDIDDDGSIGDSSFKNQFLGLQNIPVRNGLEISLRRMALNSEVEFEGAGDALPGNLVATTGTGAITGSTARHTALSVHNGCLRVAQTGDFVMYVLENPNMAVESDLVGARRIRVRRVGDYVKA